MKMKSGELKHQVEVNVPASVAWDLYGTLKLAELVEQRLPQLISKTEVVEGDGGVGTIVALTFVPGAAGPVTGFKEKFTVVDHHNRLKETELVEGGHLDLGFHSYRVTLHVTDQDPGHSCLITSTIRYEVDENNSAAEASVSIDSLAAVAAIAKDYLTNI